jgi:H+/Cl- antiporter ClcA
VASKNMKVVSVLLFVGAIVGILSAAYTAYSNISYSNTTFTTSSSYSNLAGNTGALFAVFFIATISLIFGSVWSWYQNTF